MESLRFPLQRLPRDAVLNVIKTMHMVDLMSLALSTKATKALVVSLKMKAPRVMLIIEGEPCLRLDFDEDTEMSIDIDQPQRYMYIEGKPFLEICKPAYVVANFWATVQFASIDAQHFEDTSISVWKKPSFEFQDWIQYFLDLFVGGQINQLYFCPTGHRFDIQSLKTAIEKQFPKQHSWICAEDRCSDEYLNRIYQTFQSIDFLQMTRRTPHFQKLSLQNYRELKLANFMNGVFEITLDELLGLNPTVFYLERPTRIFAKEINRFIKCWMKGAHRRLRYAKFVQKFENYPDEEELVKGTRYRRAPEDRVLSVSFSENQLIRGGWDIRGKNGRQATVAVSKVRAIWNIEMFVWD